MNRYITAILLGIVMWAIGYFAGIPLLSAQEYMHTAESVIGVFFGLLFGAWYFLRLKGSYLKEGFILGILWFVIMVALDMAFLLPLIQGGIGEWFATIGLAYLILPIQFTFLGWIVEKKVSK